MVERGHKKERKIFIGLPKKSEKEKVEIESVFYDEKGVIKIYERETSKEAIHDGELTEGFKRFCPKYKGSKYGLLESLLCEKCKLPMEEIHNNLTDCCVNDIYNRVWYCKICGNGIIECEKFPHQIL